MKESMRMKSGAAVFLAGLALGLAGCNSVISDGASPSVLKAAIDHPQDQKIFFTDGHYRQVVTLYDDGSFLRKTGDQSGLVISKEDGQWRWKRSGSHQAHLKLGEEEWNLTFIGPDDAMAVKPGGDSRLFHFESM
jgi:hypothetical protein